ncbi:MAG: glycosyltransferase [Clostridia bacterium]|nr:glycosyltransferase [Clostridia bacterium]
MEKYSVLMSVYYKENPGFFRQAVRSMLAQTVPPDDFVIVCDGCLTQELDRAIAEFEKDTGELFQIVRLPKNGGLGKALRTGITYCKYNLVARMDTDDIAVPVRMERQLRLILDNPDIGAVGGQIAEFSSAPKPTVTGYRIVPNTADGVKKRIASQNPMNHMTVLLRKDMVLKAGNYVDFPMFEDYHLWARMTAKGFLLMNDDSICVFARVDGMHQRRGGLKYFEQTRRMEQHLMQCGLLDKGTYCKNLAVRFIGTVVVPNRLRAFAYSRFLRNSHPAERDNSLLQELAVAYASKGTKAGDS